MVFFAALVARSGARGRPPARRAGRAPPRARAATGRRFLEAIWRYYNLVDFAVAMRDNKTSVAIRLAFDEAETRREAGDGRTAPDDPARARRPLQRIAQVLSTLIETSSTSARRDS